MEKTKQIPESLFYSGGTITTDDIIETSDKCKYDIALNKDYMFIFRKGLTIPFKVVKIEYQTEYTYKIMKTKVKIGNWFNEIVTDSFWNCRGRDMLNNIVKITKGV